MSQMASVAPPEDASPGFVRPPSSPSGSWTSGETAQLQADSPGGGSDGGDGAPRPKRCKISREQLTVLINSFEEEPLPNFDQRQALAKMLGMTPRSVQIWFQNRRQRLKPMQPSKALSASQASFAQGLQRGFPPTSGGPHHIGMPGLAAAAGLCQSAGGASFESLMLMSQLTNAAAGLANQQAQGSTTAPASGPSGGYDGNQSSSSYDVMEPFAATKALLGASYQHGSSTSLASLSRSPHSGPSPPAGSQLPGLGAPMHGHGYHGSSSSGLPSIDATPSTADVMGQGFKAEKADGLLLLLACADGGSEHSVE